ncbi:Eight transmembrane protein EpsH [uncultured Desulfobacterium sp.]|uniref:Eight transmembrane protein EpsH n=1 Tax=uncultured Desulfobacterium sp. TaxID=201089 RepID=A0A445MUV4_9BACT|nr:Eight transmembrane protein EpsH [uncultured Desulfobacterium sp.]
MADRNVKLNITGNIWFQASVLFLLFICAYWIPLKGIVNTWMTNEDYSYGFIIPFISIYLFWDMRARFDGLTVKANWKISPVLFVFVLLSIYGILGSSGNISRPAIPILFVLFAGFCFGREFLKRFILPLGFLVFMVPLPASVDRTFGVFLKSVSSKLGGEIIRLFGMSVNVSGNVIDLGVTQLQVVDACSGLRFVFPLLALGVVYAYFFEKVRWKQVFCVFSTVPIAILTNALRVGITGVLTYYYGPEMAQGFFHDFSGWLIFMVAFGFLFVLGRLLRFLPPSPTSGNSKGTKDSKSSDHAIKMEGGRSAFIVSTLLLIVVAVLGFNTQALPPVKVMGGISSFPLAIADWKGESIPVPSDIIEASGAEESFEGFYKNSKAENVSLYIGYRSTAFLENENFFHSPTVCLPSSGLTVIETKKRKVEGVPFFNEIWVSEMVVESMGEKRLVYFWFQTKDKATYSKDINRFHLALHAIRHDNTHDLFIRPIMGFKKDENLVDAQKRMDQFVRDMMGTLNDFLKENLIKKY